MPKEWAEGPKSAMVPGPNSGSDRQAPPGFHARSKTDTSIPAVARPHAAVRPFGPEPTIAMEVMNHFLDVFEKNTDAKTA